MFYISPFLCLGRGLLFENMWYEILAIKFCQRVCMVNSFVTSLTFVWYTFMCIFLVLPQWTLCCVFLGTKLTLIFHSFMYCLNVYHEITVICCFMIAMLAWKFNTFMDWQVMSCKMTLLSSLVITQCTGIFLVFMDRLYVSGQTSFEGKFSYTLVTLVLDFFVNWIDMICQEEIFFILFSTIWTLKP